MTASHLEKQSNKENVSLNKPNQIYIKYLSELLRNFTPQKPAELTHTFYGVATILPKANFNLELSGSTLKMHLPNSVPSLKEVSWLSQKSITSGKRI